jgi:hypothetical protein
MEKARVPSMQRCANKKRAESKSWDKLQVDSRAQMGQVRAMHGGCLGCRWPLAAEPRRLPWSMSGGVRQASASRRSCSGTGANPSISRPWTDDTPSKLLRTGHLYCCRYMRQPIC